MDTTRLALVGLGNPGPAYAETRHNAGFWLADRFAAGHQAPIRAEPRFFGDLARTRIGSTEILVLKPATFMNRSGQAVSALAHFYKLMPDQILVAYDDLDLPVGTVRLKLGGGHGGHNGLRDIHKPLGEGYRRLRIGIGHPGDRERVLSYLTRERPPRQEQDAVDASLTRALEALDIWLAQGWDKAVQSLHTSG